MKIDRLNQLFGNKVSSPTLASQNKIQQESHTNVSSIDDAVTLSSELSDEELSVRKERVASITAQVNDKTYRIDNKKVAEALIKELF